MFNTLPTRFQHYKVLKLLGSGGFGSVYLARDTDLKRLVVLKTLHPHLAADPNMVQRFLREARAMARLDHANIVRVNRVDALRDANQPFFEMEYVEGQTLAKYRGSRVLPLPEAMPILKQMAAALDAAHRQKIVHRDVKPANVLIKPDARLKLTDFGIIKLLEATGTALPSTEGIIGTPSYIAPEQADITRKHEIGPATDIYALGVIAYELLTGHLPFSGGPAPAILYAHTHTPPPDPRDFNPYLAAPVAQVLLQALNKQPNQRYLRAMIFVEALERAASGGAFARRITTSNVTTPPGGTSGTTSPTGATPAPRITTSNVTTPPTGTTPPTSTTPAPPLTPPTDATPIPPLTPPPPPERQTPPATPTTQPAISKQMMIGLVVLLLVAMIFGGVLNYVFSTGQGGKIGLDTPTLPAAGPESAPATFTLIPTEPAGPKSASATPTLGIDSTTMVGQDGMTLLYVPAGEFLRGSKEDDPDAHDDDEHPQRTIYLDAFWIDQTEVTNEMFTRFVEQEQYETDAEKEGRGRVFTGGSWQNIDGAQWRHPHGPDSSVEGLEQHPVVQISWNDAHAYCEWAGRRLPTEAEWEKAARGTDDWRYPWGNEEVAGHLVNLCDNNCSSSNNINSIDDGYEFSAPVGSYPAGASPYGALDMAGNVWEWTADSYDEAYYHNAPERNPQGPDIDESKVLRGGSWDTNDPRAARTSSRNSDGPTIRYADNGLRCASSP